MSKNVRWKGIGTSYPRDHRSVSITGHPRNRGHVMWLPHREGQAGEGEGEGQGEGGGEPVRVIRTPAGFLLATSVLSCYYYY